MEVRETLADSAADAVIGNTQGPMDLCPMLPEHLTNLLKQAEQSVNQFASLTDTLEFRAGSLVFCHIGNGA